MPNASSDSMKLRSALFALLFCFATRYAAGQQPEVYDPSKAAFWQERKINALAARLNNQPAAPTADEVAAKILEKQQRQQQVAATINIAAQLLVAGQKYVSWFAANKTAAIPPAYFEEARAIAAEAEKTGATLRTLYEVADGKETAKQLDSIAYDIRIWTAALDKK
jgi:hypothetical protein